MIRNSLLFLLLFIAVAATSWLIIGNNHEQSIKNTHSNDEMDTFATDVHITNMDKEGRLSTELDTPKLTHFSQSNQTQLQTPTLIIHSQDQPQWKITADQGQIYHHNEEVLLEHHVIIHQAKGSHNEEVTITTPAVTLFPEKKIATTNHPVQLLSDTTQINGIGMEANLIEGTLELKNAARGEYACNTH